LGNISKKDLKIHEIKNYSNENQKSDFVDFFRNSPLVRELELKRDI